MSTRLIAFLILLLLSPILIIILIITAIDLQANPIFIQTRVIAGPGTFSFYKIRSMRKIAPSLPTNLIRNPKNFITSWGRFLRTTSIDEIMNLISIVKGDMNFIGPRPIMVVETDLIELRKKCRIVSKGGITGLAQIKGRDFISPTRKIAAERYYQANKSFSLDSYILLQTLIIVMRRNGVAH
jgi:O-antigen biosynthesis protein WbqP